jgi:hypothetical protein
MTMDKGTGISRAMHATPTTVNRTAPTTHSLKFCFEFIVFFLAVSSVTAEKVRSDHDDHQGNQLHVAGHRGDRASNEGTLDLIDHLFLI